MHTDGNVIIMYQSNKCTIHTDDELLHIYSWWTITYILMMSYYIHTDDESFDTDHALFGSWKILWSVCLWIQARETSPIARQVARWKRRCVQFYVWNVCINLCMCICICVCVYMHCVSSGEIEAGVCSALCLECIYAYVCVYTYGYTYMWRLRVEWQGVGECACNFMSGMYAFMNVC
jgi:hypothetical protein